MTPILSLFWMALKASVAAISATMSRFVCLTVPKSSEPLTSTKSMTVSCAAHLYGGKLEIRLDAPDGPCVGSVIIPNTRDKFTEFTTSLKDAKGTHDLYFVFVGNTMQRKNLFNFDWWEVK